MSISPFRKRAVAVVTFSRVRDLRHAAHMNHAAMELDAAQEKLKHILAQCRKHNINPQAFKCVQDYFRETLTESKSKSKSWKCLKFATVLAVLTCCYYYYDAELSSRRCWFELPPVLRYGFRPPEDCSFCANVFNVARLHGITSAEFETKYAYAGQPVIVEDSAKNWTATAKFNYGYFRDVYQRAKHKQKILDCQFLPYKTGFKNLLDALDMPKERVELEPSTEPWYFGWSNCNPETAEEFRKHYGRPYFLPKTSENNAVDWFFIGTAGLGAHMHIDNVRLPSWQAQLSGSKRWLLMPPPECYFQCRKLEALVKPGNIIVLDTNKWYHQTFVQPGEISLTIGAEYD